MKSGSVVLISRSKKLTSNVSQLSGPNPFKHNSMLIGTSVGEPDALTMNKSPVSARAICERNKHNATVSEVKIRFSIMHPWQVNTFW
jgi:hypothetical protein